MPTFRANRLLSTPFGVTGYNSWAQPISDEIVDEDVGLLLEADAVA